MNNSPSVNKTTSSVDFENGDGNKPTTNNPEISTELADQPTNREPVDWEIASIRENLHFLFKNPDKVNEPQFLSDQYGASFSICKQISDLIRQTHLDLLREVEKYNELIMAVGNKYDGETRHETALRYIKQAEKPSSQVSQVMEGK